MKNSKVIQFMIRQEKKAVEWKARNGLNILRVSLGLVFIWFGILKFFPGIAKEKKTNNQNTKVTHISLSRKAEILNQKLFNLARISCPFTIDNGFIGK